MQDAMNAIKERLTGYNALKQESAGLLERLARMKAAAEFPAPAEPDGSQHTTGDGQRMARAIEDYVEYEERITPQLEKTAQRCSALSKPWHSFPTRWSVKCCACVISMVTAGGFLDGAMWPWCCMGMMTKNRYTAA